MYTEQSKIDEMCRLAQEGKSTSEISKILNVSSRTVRKYTKDLISAPKNCIKGNEELIIKLYQDGCTQKEIADRLGTYNTSIRRVLLKYNIPVRNISEVNRFCKDNPFKDGDEYSEYFLGLFLTDGCITKCKQAKRNYCEVLALNEEDANLIEKYRNWISPDTKISKIYQKINGSYMHSVSISNPDVEAWLRSHGNFTNKSHDCEIYCPITWHILRGIFDGDGGYHKNGKHLDFFICGASKKFICQIIDFLEKEGFEPHLRVANRNEKEFYYIELYKIQEVIKLGELMYNNASIYMQRKYDKWLSFYESKRDKQALNSGKLALDNPEQNSSNEEDVQRL